MSKNTAAIIEFPPDKIKRKFNATKEEMDEALLRSKIRFTQYVLDKIGSQLKSALERDGINVDDPRITTDFLYSLETIKSLVLKANGLPHAIQHFVEMSVQVEDPIQEPGVTTSARDEEFEMDVLFEPEFEIEDDTE